MRIYSGCILTLVTLVVCVSFNQMVVDGAICVYYADRILIRGTTQPRLYGFVGHSEYRNAWDT